MNIRNDVLENWENRKVLKLLKSNWKQNKIKRQKHKNTKGNWKYKIKPIQN